MDNTAAMLVMAICSVLVTIAGTGLVGYFVSRRIDKKHRVSGQH